MHFSFMQRVLCVHIKLKTTCLYCLAGWLSNSATNTTLLHCHGGCAGGSPCSPCLCSQSPLCYPFHSSFHCCATLNCALILLFSPFFLLNLTISLEELVCLDLVFNLSFVIIVLVLISLFPIIVPVLTLLIKERKGVVCVGLVCLDLVTVVDHFPKEDTDMRSLAQYKVSPILKMQGT